MDHFRPREVTSQDRDAGLCTVSQFPTQADQMISGENPSQFESQSQNLRNAPSLTGGSRINSLGEELQESSDYSKKARLSESVVQKELLSSGVHLDDSICKINLVVGNNKNDNFEPSHSVPDVAAAIEDLLEQTSKVIPLMTLQLLF